MSLLNLTIKEVTDNLDKKEISAEELVKEYIKSSEKADELNIYITKTFEMALEEAKESDKRRAKNKQLSNIDGVPIAVKDNFLTENIKTTNASKLLSNFIAPYESTITSNLKNAGCINLGKLNMDEFAMGSANTNSYFGNVINPWWENEDEKKVPGGSSGGSAASVAARSCLAALGTDTGGSVRQPAAFCGVVGIKPTYGTCSRYGIIAFASSLDQAGIITRDVQDSALLLQHMAGYDEKDSSMVKFQVPDYSRSIGKSIKGKKIGIPKEFRSEDSPSYVIDFWDMAKKALIDVGAEIVEISLPFSKYALPCYYMIAPAEASSNFARFDGIRYGCREEADNLEDTYRKTREKGWGEEVKTRILSGIYNLQDSRFDKYIRATKIRRLITNDFFEAFKLVDAILVPTTNSSAFGFHDNVNPKDMWHSDLYTVANNLAGIPGINVPVGLNPQGLPFGMQLITGYFQEEVLYQIAYKLEQSIQFNNISSFVKKHNLF